MPSAFYAIPIIMFIAGLFIGRWNGGGRPKFLKWLDNPFSQILYAYPYLLILLAAVPVTVITAPAWLAGFHIFLIFVLTVIMILKGHGHNMDLGTSDPRGLPEWYEGALYKALYGKIPNYWYDAIGLVISGLTYTLPVGLYLGNPLLALSGALKAPAYMLGRALYDWKPEFFNMPKLAMDAATAWGEAFTCAALHAAAGVILVHILVNIGFIWRYSVDIPKIMLYPF